MKRKEISNVETLLNKPIKLKNTINASKLWEMSQNRLQVLIKENYVLVLRMKNGQAIVMIGMGDFEQIKNQYEEQRNYIEELEQRLEDMEIINDLGEEYFRTPKATFIEVPENMSAKQFRGWTNGTIEEAYIVLKEMWQEYKEQLKEIDNKNSVLLKEANDKQTVAPLFYLTENVGVERKLELIESIALKLGYGYYNGSFSWKGDKKI